MDRIKCTNCGHYGTYKREAVVYGFGYMTDKAYNEYLKFYFCSSCHKPHNQS